MRRSIEKEGPVRYKISEEIALDVFLKGDTPLAVRMFEALSLVYPEKAQHWQNQITLLSSPIDHNPFRKAEEDSPQR